MKPEFETLVTRYINLVYYFAKRWVKEPDDLHDVVHETYLKAFKTYDRFQYTSEGQLKSWLLTICRNIIMDSFKVKPMVPFNDEITTSTVSEMDTWLETEIHNEDMKAVVTELKKMDPQDQEIIKLRIFDQMNFKQISSIFNISLAAAKMRFYRVIAQLNKQLI